MEPHSRPSSTRNGTLRFPQALLLLLRTAIAGPTSDRVTQTDTVPSNIKESAYCLLQLFNPFVVSGGRWTLSSVGMVELTALCGIGSALYLWNKRNGRGSVEAQHAIDVTAGKSFFEHWRDVDLRSRGMDIQLLANANAF
jgi:hypothetical protein